MPAGIPAGILLIEYFGYLSAFKRLLETGLLRNRMAATRVGQADQDDRDLLVDTRVVLREHVG